MSTVGLIGMGQPCASLAEVRDGLTRRFRAQRVEDALIECLNQLVNSHHDHFPSSAGSGGHYLDRVAIDDLRLGPFGATDDLTVDRDRHSAWLNGETAQQLLDRFDDEGLLLTVDADHNEFSANRIASRAAIGASVTPWRK